MDYPKSVPNVGLVDGKFIDENTVTGAVGSLIPSVWGNAVTDEILTVIKAAGIVPSEGATDQLLKAIRGSSMFSTQPQFTSTKDVATTEFVENVGLHFSPKTRYYSVAAQLVMGAQDIGTIISFNGTASQTAKLPPTVSLPIGSTIRLIRSYVTQAVILTITSDDGSAKIDAQSSALVSSINLLGGEEVTATWSGAAWILSGAYTFRINQMRAVMGASGYKVLDGMILQWGGGVTNASGQAVLVPWIAFPNSVMKVFVTASGSNTVATLGAVSLNSIGINTYAGSTGAGKPENVQYFAIGY
jgi:hypothetical protein